MWYVGWPQACQPALGAATLADPELVRSMAGQTVYFKQLELGPMQNFIYLVGDPERREVAVIDPGWEASEILRTVEKDGYRLTMAVVTHHHFDHVMGLSDLLKKIDLPVYVHREDAPLLRIGRSSLRVIGDGDNIALGDIDITAIHTPGHTPGSQCLLVENRLLSGDTLFIRACGRWDLPGGDPTQLYNSLTQKLKNLDDTTAVYPGHNYAEIPISTLGQERESNPFFQPPTLEAFLKLIRQG